MLRLHQNQLRFRVIFKTQPSTPPALREIQQKRDYLEKLV
jgi:hypothetical protein